MNRWTGSTVFAALLMALILPGCPEEQKVDEQQALVDLAMEARQEALGLLEAAEVQASQETFQRAYRHALDAVSAEGNISRPDLLNTLAELCCQLGRWSPDYLGRAVRYCHMALAAGPGWGLPYYNLGLAYEWAGLYADSVRAYEMFFETVPSDQFPPDVWEGLKDNLVRALFRQAGEILKEDRIGAEGRARVVLEKAYALRPIPSSAPQIHQALTEINAMHERQTREAVDAGDGLEIVRIHARFGFPVPAETALQRYKDTSGSNSAVRFVEARYVRELAGTPESNRQAADIYLDLLTRGEMVVHAAAGYGRTLLALGEGDQALERLADFPNPTAELRRTLILLRIDRIKRLPISDAEAAAAEFERISELMLTGGLGIFDRAQLYWATAIAALNREDADQLENVIGAYQQRFPQDPRVAILDAELKQLRGIPVEEVFAEVGNE